MTRGMRRAALTAVLVAAIAAAPATAARALDEVPELEPEVTVVADAAPAEGDDDMTPPVITVGGLDTSWVYELGAEFALEYTCTDPESGIVSCTEADGHLSGDIVRLSVDGLNVFTVTGVNGAGISWSGTLHVWAQIPELVSVRAIYDPHRQSLNGWFDTPIDGTIRAWRDDELAIRDIRYRIDGREWIVTSGSEVAVPFTTEGRYLLEYLAFDADMGFSTLIRRWIALDFTAPAIWYPEGIDGGEFPRGYEQALWASCEDLLSGVDTCAFDEGEWLPTDVPGEHTVTARGTDDAGNEVVRVLRYTVLGAEGEEPGDDEQPDDEQPGGEQPGDGGGVSGGVSGQPARPATGAGVLASTGVDSGVWMLLIGGLALVGLGAGATILTRRTRLSS